MVQGAPAAVHAPAVWKGALLTVVVLALQLWLFSPVTAAYFPTLDEIPMQAASTDTGGPIAASSWVTQGLHGYFVPYPEWTQPSVDYWRPLANAWYWLCHQLFGQHWAAQLMLGYLAHALVAGLIWYLARGALGLGPLPSFLAVAVAVLNPAYVFQSASDPFSIPRAIQFPVYQLEVLTALLMIVAVLAFIRGRYLAFGLIATAAALLKETALLLPVGALVVLWLQGGSRQQGGEPQPRGEPQRGASARWLLLPLVVWGCGRLLARLAVGSGHLVDFPGLKQWLSKVVRNLLLWPTGLYQGRIGATRHALAAHAWSSVAADIAALLANLAWWLLLAAALLAVRRARADQPGSATLPAWIIVLVFALSNLVGALLLPASELRYGYLWLALGPAALFAGLAQRRWSMAAGVILTVCLLLPQVHSLSRALSDPPLQAYRLAKQSARQLSSLLASEPGTVRIVYLVDDLAVQSASPEYFAKFSSFGGKLVLINNLAPVRGCQAAAAAAGVRYQLHRAEGIAELNYVAPECFAPAWNVAPLDQFDSGHFIQRGAAMTYHLPELSIRSQWFEGGGQFDYDAGRRWSVRVREPACEQAGACLWLGFDPAARAYFAVGG